MTKPERIPFQVGKSRLLPANGIAERMFAERGYQHGDTVMVEIKRPRNPRQWFRMHRLAQLVQQNIDAFEYLESAHAVVKQLQLDARVACDLVDVVTEDGEAVRAYYPRSLAYESMTQDEFWGVYRALCRHIATTYWPEVDEDQVADMAEMMPREVA